MGMTVIFIILLIISLMIFAILLIHFGITLFDYHQGINDEQTMTFKQFENLYYTNPDKWMFKDYSIPYVSYYYEGNSYTDIYMSHYLDSIKLKKMFANIKDKLKEKEKIEERKDLLKYWQKDIDDYNNKILKEMKGLLKNENQSYQRH